MFSLFYITIERKGVSESGRILKTNKQAMYTVHVYDNAFTVCYSSVQNVMCKLVHVFSLVLVLVHVCVIFIPLHVHIIICVEIIMYVHSIIENFSLFCLVSNCM